VDRLPLTILHVPSELGDAKCRKLAQETRKVIIEALGAQPIRVKVLVYQTPAQYRAVHEERDSNFVLAEVMLFQGRPRELKDRLLKDLSGLIMQQTGLTPDNVFVCLQESPRQNWGIMGGTPADKADLGY